MIQRPLIRIAKTTAHFVAPKWAEKTERRIWLKRRALELKTICSGKKTLEEIVDEVLAFKSFRPIQIRSEIFRLLEIVRELKPLRLCEIGGNAGGSLFLLSRAAEDDARLLSVDLDYTTERKDVLQTFGREGQIITCMQADSHQQSTRDKVEHWLDGERLDFLFIDGDHSFEGVASDFAMYAPLVRPNGVIAFHDIVPDSRTRYGIETNHDVGQVPKFWTELKRKYSGTEELVDDPDQDGYGIGVLRWPGEMS